MRGTIGSSVSHKKEATYLIRQEQVMHSSFMNLKTAGIFFKVQWLGTKTLIFIGQENKEALQKNILSV